MNYYYYRLKPVVTDSAHDTVHPALEIHSTTPVWPGADYSVPKGVGPPGGEERPRVGHRSAPTPKLTLGPTEATRMRSADGVPP